MSLKLSLAPFKGLTQKEYRNAYIRHFTGLDKVFAPFISGVHADKVNLSKFADLVPVPQNGIEIIPQFVSVDAEEIIAVAETLASLGYKEINWNMGCPFSRIANKMRGCGILPYPDQMRSMMDRIMPVIPVKLSVKTRLGYYSTDELPRVIKVLNDYPISELIIHARIGKQLYAGKTDPESFLHCAAISKIPVTYNGDIYHADTFKELQQIFPTINSWMVGRGALINPFLPSQIKRMDLDETGKRRRLQAFHDEVFDRLQAKIPNERKLIGQMKAIWYYMHGVFEGGKQLFNDLKVCMDRQSYLTFAQRLLQLPFADNRAIENHWMQGLKQVGAESNQ
jgi:tRNA-dihydrouridine synthase